MHREMNKSEMYKLNELSESKHSWVTGTKVKK